MRFRFIPESSRWLVVNGRLDEGLRVIRHTCAVNQTSLPPDFDLKQLDQVPVYKLRFKHIRVYLQIISNNICNNK